MCMRHGETLFCYTIYIKLYKTTDMSGICSSSILNILNILVASKSENYINSKFHWKAPTLAKNKWYCLIIGKIQYLYLFIKYD